MNKILTLANDVPDPAGLLIPEVCHILLEVIHDCIGLDFTTWEDFTDAIKAISKSSIDDMLAEDKKVHLVIEELRAATAAACTILLQQSPTAPLCHMLQNTAISLYPQSPVPQPQFHQNPPPLSPRSSTLGTRGPQAPGTQAPTVFCSNELQAADAQANTLPHHHNTPAGRVLYVEQVAAWNKAFPGCLKANKFCP